MSGIKVSFASGVCGLVGYIGLGNYTGFLAGLTGTCPLVGKGCLVSLVGQPLSRSAFRSSCGLGKTLDSLFFMGEVVFQPVGYLA